MNKGIYCSLLLAVVCLTPVPVLAEGFGINSTRVIFNQAESHASVTFRNTTTKTPYLVQVMLTQDAEGVRENTPFSLLPPIFRLEPDSRQQVRINGKPASLPSDRESVFYLNARAIPSTTDTVNTRSNAQIRVGVANVIKLFYRPSNLPMTPGDALQALSFSAVGDGIKAINKSPYYISLASLSFNHQPVTLKIGSGNAMIAPFGDYVYPTSVRQGKVTWGAINDYGATETFHAVIQ